MSNLRHYLPAIIPGFKTSLEDVRFGDPVLVVATNEIVVGLFDSADFTADEVSVNVTRNGKDEDDDVSYSATDESVDGISVYVLPRQMNLSDILVNMWETVVSRHLIGSTCVWAIDDTSLTRAVVGYVGYGYGENDDERIALEEEPYTEYGLPDTYKLLEVIR